MSQYHYVYVLRSAADGNLYTGFSSNLQHRMKDHAEGRVPTTTGRRPLELIYYEACRSRADATRREKYLKSAWGKRFLKSRLRDYLTG